MSKLNKENRAKQVDELVREVRHLRSEITKSAASVNTQDKGGFLGRKGVLGGVGIISDIYNGGPKSMPQLLEDRSYTRQHLHDLVKRLEADGLVEYQDNPNHKSSKLIAATDEGVKQMLARRQVVMDTIVPLSSDITEKQMETAIKVIHTFRKAWKALNEQVTNDYR